MARKRGLLFAGAAAGAAFSLVGCGAVIWAWFYPGSLVDTLGANVTPEDLRAGLRVQLFGTIGGALLAAAGIGAAVLCFRALNRDMDRMREEMGVGRRLTRR